MLQGGMNLKSLLIAAAASLSVGASAPAQQLFKIANYEVTAPAGWHEVRGTLVKLVLRSSDDHQQATLSVTKFDSTASPEHFRSLCWHRLEAERRELQDGFISPESPEPTKDGETFSLLYSGGERGTGRVFSEYLTMTGKDLLSLYVEGVGVAAKEHLEAFRSFTASVKRR